MNQEKINDLLHKVMDIKYDTQQVIDDIGSMDSAYEEQTGREQALDREVAELKDKNQGLYDDRAMLEKNVQFLRDENERLKRNVEYDKAVARGWKDKYYAFKETLIKAEDPRVNVVMLEKNDQTPTMPVIPKDVAIAIFREGIKEGVYNVCDELDNSDTIEIEDSGYTGGFEVSFSKCIDLSEHLNLDWMRGKVGNYEELNVTNALKGLCETKKFECRIHGIDDNPTIND